MAAVRAQIWGLCPSCQRWFYCEGWFDKTAAEPTCPVCAWEPVAIEHRAPGLQARKPVLYVCWERATDGRNPAGWLNLEE